MSDETRRRRQLARRRLVSFRQRVALHATAYVRPAPPPAAPVFIVGCPRSGTTLLSALVRRHPALKGTGSEGHLLWNAHQHPSKKGWASDRSTAGDIARDERRFLYSAIHAIAGERRFVDKTPKNALRVPYLDALFPDATFVLIARDGRANVASLIEGWTVHHGVSYLVPDRLELGTYRGRCWSYILPPDWRSMIRTSVEDVAAFQYATTNETVLDDLAAIAPERVVRVAFEDLLAEPVAVAERLVAVLGLAPSTAVAEFAASLDDHQMATTSPPRPDKWRDRAAQIERILPRIAPAMQRLGYAAEGADS